MHRCAQELDQVTVLVSLERLVLYALGALWLTIQLIIMVKAVQKAAKNLHTSTLMRATLSMVANPLTVRTPAVSTSSRTSAICVPAVHKELSGRIFKCWRHAMH